MTTIFRFGIELSKAVAVFFTQVAIVVMVAFECATSRATILPGCSRHLNARALNDAAVVRESDLDRSHEEKRRSWFENPDWSGLSSIPAPLDGSVTVSDSRNPTPSRIFFAVASIKDLPADLRALLKNLKARSRPLSPEEREMGAIVAHYASGSSKGVRFTSYVIDGIEGTDMNKAINQSNVFPNRENESVTKVFHLHTHPNLKNPIFGGRRTLILPSLYDFNLWLVLRAQLREFHPDVAFRGIVAPAGRNVEDIVFIVGDQHLDAYANCKESEAGNPL